MRELNLGRAGEVIAGKLLVARGFAILERNFTCLLGEIDLIAQYHQTRYFVEVKTRSGVSFGYPGESVNVKKQQRLRRLASYYIVAKGYRGPLAFGVVEVIYQPISHRYQAVFIDHAF